MSLRLQQNRNSLIAAIQLHINDEQCMMFADVELVAELVWALTWSRDTRRLAYTQMDRVVQLNTEERSKEDAKSNT